MREKGALLRVGQRRQLEAMKGGKERVVQSGWTRRAQQRVALRREHLCHVPLDALALGSRLVEPVDEEEGLVCRPRRAQP